MTDSSLQNPEQKEKPLMQNINLQNLNNLFISLNGEGVCNPYFFPVYT